VDDDEKSLIDLASSAASSSLQRKSVSRSPSPAAARMLNPDDAKDLDVNSSVEQGDDANKALKRRRGIDSAVDGLNSVLALCV
jgi:hypothetical protein